MSERERMLQAVRTAFPRKRVAVVGDLMVDEYVTGRVSRISPEAPVAILNYRGRHREAGGASNVARNLRSLGARVSVIGTAAEDEHGQWLRQHLREDGIDSDGIVCEEGRPTTVKTRFASRGQQLLRMDSEDAHAVGTRAMDMMLDFLGREGCAYDAVILSDYRKGVLNDGSFVREIIARCARSGMFVSIDSKGRDIEAFAGADFVKPNNLELEEAVGIRIEDDASLDRAGLVYLSRSGAKALVVTRGAAGISVFTGGTERRDYASKAADVYDVTGAGDTVISVATLGMVSGLSMDEAVRLANLAAGIVVGKAGTATVTPQELEERINAG